MKLLKFSADWCRPCKVLRKHRRYRFTCPRRAMDVDQEQVLARSYGVRGVPTVILVDATGKALKRFSGVKSKAI